LAVRVRSLCCRRGRGCCAEVTLHAGHIARARRLFERAGGGRRAGVPGGQDDLERANTDYRHAGLDAVERGVGATEHLRHMSPVEPLGAGLGPRQVEHHPYPVQLRLGDLGSGAEHLVQPVRQRLVNGTRQTGAVERPTA
jgi:hypothetical protein